MVVIMAMILRAIWGLNMRIYPRMIMGLISELIPK